MVLKELFRQDEGVFSLSSDARISDTAALMQREKIGCVVIVDGETVVGIITDRDIALGVALGAATPDSFVSEVMSTDVKTVSDSMSLFDVTRYFRTVNFKRLPVVDDKMRLVGIVSTDDVMAMLSREMFDTCSALESKLGHMV